ncbi:hypothetical protein Peur_063877 [Populus x canadensis]
MRTSIQVARFGSVVLISSSDFMREVSQTCLDVQIVVLMYKNGYAEYYNLPTLLVYNNGAVIANFVGLRRFQQRSTSKGNFHV